MRSPSLQTDGWHLLDAEEYHRAAPATFPIPAAAQREGMQIGDFAKLMFEFSTGGELVVERMWVLVTARTDDGYVGVLDNDPRELAENDELWSGTQLPFGARHVIAIQRSDERSIAMAAQMPRRPWV